MLSAALASIMVLYLLQQRLKSVKSESPTLGNIMLKDLIDSFSFTGLRFNLIGSMWSLYVQYLKHSNEFYLLGNMEIAP
ncbi:hypothetical protein SCA6_015703 [Theobroma cacao]